MVRKRQHEVFLITRKKTSRRGALLITIEIPTICLYNLEPNLIIYYRNDNGERHKLADMCHASRLNILTVKLLTEQ